MMESNQLSTAPEEPNSRRTSWWPIGFIVAGLVLVGALYGCVLFADPSRGIVGKAYLYAPLLFMPYALAALGAWMIDKLPGHRAAVRILGMGVCAGGAVILGAVIIDIEPVFRGQRPPDMPVSGFVGGFVLFFGQYPAALGTVMAGLGARRNYRAEPARLRD